VDSSPTDSLGLGRLDRLADLRQVWQHEAASFTPWLASNIEVLGDAIGLPLTVVGQEVPVGDFRLDIEAQDPEGNLVLVENQLEASDHAHLGQLLVYASGVDASTVVWITTRLREEHRSALTWLNERTDTDIRFFCLEVGLVRIGSSALAPTLEAVVEPNDWTKVAKQAAGAGASELNQARMAFYERVFDLLAADYPAIRQPRLRAENWISFASGPMHSYTLVFARDGYRVEVYLDAQDYERTKALFDQLAEQRADIEERLGFELTWERLDNRRGSRLATYHPGVDPLTDDETALAAAARWSADRVIALHRQVDGLLRSLVQWVRQQA
jgi:hypothetical protein